MRLLSPQTEVMFSAVPADFDEHEDEEDPFCLEPDEAIFVRT
jgi:hypothetical protein